MSEIEKVTGILDANGISHDIIRHAAVVTCAESKEIVKVKNCCSCKNILLKTRNSGKLYLVVLRADKNLDLRMISGYIGTGRLEMAGEDELGEFGVIRGSVSPFMLINDSKQLIRLVFDNDVLRAERVKFHPNDNTASVILPTNGLLKFLCAIKRTYIALDL